MDFQGGLIVLIIFVSLFAIWLIFYFIPVGLWFSALVSGVTGLSLSRVEASISSLERSGLIEARRWSDSGCWSARLLLGGVL